MNGRIANFFQLAGFLSALGACEAGSVPTTVTDAAAAVEPMAEIRDLPSDTSGAGSGQSPQTSSAPVIPEASDSAPVIPEASDCMREVSCPPVKTQVRYRSEKTSFVIKNPNWQSSDFLYPFLTTSNPDATAGTRSMNAQVSVAQAGLILDVTLVGSVRQDHQIVASKTIALPPVTTHPDGRIVLKSLDSQWCAGICTTVEAHFVARTLNKQSQPYAVKLNNDYQTDFVMTVKDGSWVPRFNTPVLPTGEIVIDVFENTYYWKWGGAPFVLTGPDYAWPDINYPPRSNPHYCISKQGDLYYPDPGPVPESPMSSSSCSYRVNVADGTDLSRFPFSLPGASVFLVTTHYAKVPSTEKPTVNQTLLGKTKADGYLDFTANLDPGGYIYQNVWDSWTCDFDGSCHENRGSDQARGHEFDYWLKVTRDDDDSVAEVPLFSNRPHFDAQGDGRADTQYWDGSSYVVRGEPGLFSLTGANNAVSIIWAERKGTTAKRHLKVTTTFSGVEAHRDDGDVVVQVSSSATFALDDMLTAGTVSTNGSVTFDLPSNKSVYARVLVPGGIIDVPSQQFKLDSDVEWKVDLVPTCRSCRIRRPLHSSLSNETDGSSKDSEAAEVFNSMSGMSEASRRLPAGPTCSVGTNSDDTVDIWICTVSGGEPRPGLVKLYLDDDDNRETPQGIGRTERRPVDAGFIQDAKGLGECVVFKSLLRGQIYRPWISSLHGRTFGRTRSAAISTEGKSVVKKQLEVPDDERAHYTFRTTGDCVRVPGSPEVLFCNYEEKGHTVDVLAEIKPALDHAKLTVDEFAQLLRDAAGKVQRVAFKEFAKSDIQMVVTRDDYFVGQSGIEWWAYALPSWRRKAGTCAPALNPFDAQESPISRGDTIVIDPSSILSLLSGNLTNYVRKDRLDAFTHTIMHEWMHLVDSVAGCQTLDVCAIAAASLIKPRSITYSEQSSYLANYRSIKNLPTKQSDVLFEIHAIAEYLEYPDGLITNYPSWSEREFFADSAVVGVDYLAKYDRERCLLLGEKGHTTRATILSSIMMRSTLTGVTGKPATRPSLICLPSR